MWSNQSNDYWLTRYAWLLRVLPKREEYGCILLCGKLCSADDSWDSITIQKCILYRTTIRNESQGDFEKGPKGHFKMNNANVSLSNACNVERKKSHRKNHPRG